MQGIVVASTRDCAKLGPGWTRFSKGERRFLVGIGTSIDKNRIMKNFSMKEDRKDDKGEYKHQLKKRELPNYNLEESTLQFAGFHSHGLEFRMSEVVGLTGENRFMAESDMRSEEQFVENILRTSSGGEHEHSIILSSDGSNEYHNNIAPHVAFFSCEKKDGNSGARHNIPRRRDTGLPSREWLSRFPRSSPCVPSPGNRPATPLARACRVGSLLSGF